jgi:hypothetical protein
MMVLAGKCGIEQGVSFGLSMGYHQCMKVIATRPEDTVDEETKRILKERDATFEEDRKTAIDAREAIASIRRNLQTMTPR